MPTFRKRLLRKLHAPKFPPVMQPASVSLGAVIILSIVVAVSQGIDYMARPIESSFTLSIVEQKLSLNFWGAIFLVFAAVAMVGLTFTIWPLAVIGHGVLSVTYFAFSVGIFWSLAVDWRGYGWNTGVLYLCLAAFHGLLTDGCYDEWAREWKRPPPPVETDKG